MPSARVSQILRPQRFSATGAISTPRRTADGSRLRRFWPTRPGSECAPTESTKESGPTHKDDVRGRPTRSTRHAELVHPSLRDPPPSRCQAGLSAASGPWSELEPGEHVLATRPRYWHRLAHLSDDESRPRHWVRSCGLNRRTSWGQPHASAILPAHILAASSSATSTTVSPPRNSLDST
jgi:hypothetical protein